MAPHIQHVNDKVTSELLTRICDWAAGQHNPWVSSGHWAGWWMLLVAPGCSTWRWTLGCVRRSPGRGKGSGRGFWPCGGACWAAPSRDWPISPTQMRKCVHPLRCEVWPTPISHKQDVPHWWRKQSRAGGQRSWSLTEGPTEQPQKKKSMRSKTLLSATGQLQALQGYTFMRWGSSPRMARVTCW